MLNQMEASCEFPSSSWYRNRDSRIENNLLRRELFLGSLMQVAVASPLSMVTVMLFLVEIPSSTKTITMLKIFLIFIPSHLLIIKILPQRVWILINPVEIFYQGICGIGQQDLWTLSSPTVTSFNCSWITLCESVVVSLIDESRCHGADYSRSLGAMWIRIPKWSSRKLPEIPAMGLPPLDKGS